jgi:outer membrane receptor protein involved in Fe transport
MKFKLFASAALAPLAFAGVVHAQDADQPTSVEEIIVTGQPIFRNRTEDVVPTLSYDLEYFQRFEPLTVGDALKRVPSVTFLSDVIESDGVRLRGLDPGYTQILINGERVTGAGVDRSFFVDRIPAELIERIEVVRSSSANRSGDAVAGAINIVLRDAYTLDGGYLRVGALRFDDGEFRGTYGAVFGGEVGPGRLLVGANIQDRYNPKIKFSQRFDEPGGDLENSELQTDTRDGTDYSFNAAYEVDVAGGELELSGLFVRTDRYEEEDSLEYDAGIVTPANLLTINANDTDIVTDNYSFGARYERDMFGGETVFKVTYAGIDDEQFEFEDEQNLEDDEFEQARVLLDIQDEEFAARISHEREFGDMELEFGFDYIDKTRDNSVTESEADGDLADFPAAEADFSDYEAVTGGLNTIEETRFDPYVMLSGEMGAAKWEAGLRYETTDVTVTDETADPADRVSENDYGVLLPSASLRYALSDTDRLTFSVARTVRRPNFNYLSPALLEEEVGDSDFLGNPNLEPETAIGVDLGFERRLGTRGVVGVNVFYRDVTDLIEVTNTGDEGSEGPGTFIYTVDNVGDGQVYGIEFDLSTPLDFVGLENTGVFLNYSWLDSQIEDFIGERRFNGQSDFVFSAGFTHDIPAWGVAFGSSYRQQGDAFDRVLAEEVTTSYGEDLEIFIEKTFGENIVLRLTGSNLLNASKDEVFDKFDNEEEQIDRDYDEYEIESENAQGPIYQLVLRVAF